MDSNELIVVDYKATSKKDEVTIDEPWQIAYKRQIEFYQWLLRMNEENISNTAYFVYLNGKKDNLFENKLDFVAKVLPYKGNTNWILPVITQIFNVLESDNIPESSVYCEYCIYVTEFSNSTSRLF